MILAYSVDPFSNATVHQYITKESKYVWDLIPSEIKNHLTQSITEEINGHYNSELDDDIITGSGEQDKTLETELALWTTHYWNPDTITLIEPYNDGLFISGSNYVKAKDIWETRAIDNYMRGNIDEAYYWLGHVAHLLQDVSQPSHVHNDCHIEGTTWVGCLDDSMLEEFTAANTNYWGDTSGKMNVEHFEGTDYVSDGPYYYENLIDEFDWSEIEPEKRDFFFRLFWYTAQKTQYFASDEVERDFTYNLLSDENQSWDCEGSGNNNLWNDKYAFCSNFTSREQMGDNEESNNGTFVAAEATAMIPHAMRATAGLFRLFWDTVHSYSWPTFHHDNRRTGFTILKGDIKSESELKNKNVVITSDVQSDMIARISVADLDQNGKQEVIAGVTGISGTNYTEVIGYEIDTGDDGKYPETVWRYPATDNVVLPILGDLTSNTGLEVVFGYSDASKITAIKIDGKKATKEWDFTLDSKASTEFGGSTAGYSYFMAIEDLDHDGSNEVIAMDSRFLLSDWPGEVYVIDGADGTEIDSYTVGNGGGNGVAVVDLDQDDKMDILAATYYGLYRLEYDNGNLNYIWATTDGRIRGNPVVEDVDRDNAWEIIYTTADYECEGGKTCANKLYIKDKDKSDEKNAILMDEYPMATPAVANVDEDSSYEIIMVASNEEDPKGFGKILVYDVDDWELQCNYSNNGAFEPRQISPSIADINGDGINEIIIPERNTKKVHIIDGTDCTEVSGFPIDYEGIIGSSIAIADLDNDGKAELAVKRSGSPYAIITITSMNNDPPYLNYLDNLTAIAGDLIDLNSTGALGAVDPDGDALSFNFGAPFNSSGLWQSTENDTGNYTVLVEVSDGNLTDYTYVDVLVFDDEAIKQTNFTDGTEEKYLDFTSPTENKTVEIRIPKDSAIQYARMKITGGAS